MAKKKFFRVLVPISILTRLTSPFIIFSNPLVAVVLCTFFDMTDSTLYRQSSYTKKKYQPIDKTLDFWWYGVSLVYAINANLPFLNLIILLFTIRLIGQLVFYFTRNEIYYILFPNFYEHFLVFIIILESFPKYNYLVNPNFFVKTLLVIFVAKIVQELIAHKYDLLYYPYIPEFMKGPED